MKRFTISSRFADFHSPLQNNSFLDFVCAFTQKSTHTEEEISPSLFTVLSRRQVGGVKLKQGGEKKDTGNFSLLLSTPLINMIKVRQRLMYLEQRPSKTSQGC